eukprot:1654705-Prymnesium_polylepis.1
MCSPSCERHVRSPSCAARRRGGEGRGDGGRRYIERGRGARRQGEPAGATACHGRARSVATRLSTCCVRAYRGTPHAATSNVAAHGRGQGRAVGCRGVGC